MVGGLCYIGSKIERPGVIHHTGTMQRLIFGEYDGRTTARVEALHEACVRSGINAEISANIRRAIWEKFVLIVGVSAATTTMRSTIGPIVRDPRSRSFLLEVMRETVAVGRAQDVALSEDFAERRLAFCDTLPPEMDSSMHADLDNGNRLEVDWLSGAVADLGKAANVPAPMNSAVRFRSAGPRVKMAPWTRSRTCSGLTPP